MSSPSADKRLQFIGDGYNMEWVYQSSLHHPHHGYLWVENAVLLTVRT